MDEWTSYQIIYTAGAVADMEEKADYLMSRFREPTLAERWYTRLRDTIQKQLTTLPYKYPAYPVEPWSSNGVRFFDSRNDVVLYSVEESQHVVYILTICTKGRDIPSHLDGKEE